MKIGIFSNFYPPATRGGAELIAQRIADELSRRGHRVFVLSTMPFLGVASLTPKCFEDHVARIYRFFPLNLYHLFFAHRYSFFWRLLWHVIDLFGPFPHKLVDRLLHTEKPDVVLTHNLVGLGVSSARRIQKLGIRHIHTLHDVQLSIPSGVLMLGEEKRWLNHGWPRRLYEHCAKRSIGTPNVVISPTKFLAQFYAERGFFQKMSVRILPNCSPKLLNAAVRSASHQNKPIRFLFVGQLEPHKGVKLLLDATERLSFSCELHFAGDGSCSTLVTQRIEQNKKIFTHGFISLEHLKKLIAESDAVIIPSVCYENSPTVIYEAFQIGTPVIASRIGGIPEIIQDAVNGLLIEPGNIDSLMHAMNQIAQNRDFFWTQQTQIRKIAETYSLEQYVNELEKLLGGGVSSL